MNKFVKVHEGGSFSNVVEAEGTRAVTLQLKGFLVYFSVLPSTTLDTR